MRFASLILKNLTRRRFRTAMTLSALATAVAAVVALLGIARGFTKSFAEVYTAHGVDVVVSRQGSADRLSSSVDQSFAPRIEQLPAVQRAAGVLLETLSFEEQGVYGVPSMGIQPVHGCCKITACAPAKPCLKMHRKLCCWCTLGRTIEGRAGRDDRSVRGKVPRGWNLRESQHLGKRFDDHAPIATAIAHRSTRPSHLHKRSIEIARLRRYCHSSRRIDPIARRKTARPCDRRLRRLRHSHATVRRDGLDDLSRRTFHGAIGTLNTMMTSVLERTREIGILRAIGWPRRRIVTMVLAESCTIAVAASLLGVLLAIVGTWALAQAPAARGILSPSIDAAVLLQGILLAVSIGVLGALLPAFRAAQMQPTEAFREVT